MDMLKRLDKAGETVVEVVRTVEDWLATFAETIGPPIGRLIPDLALPEALQPRGRGTFLRRPSTSGKASPTRRRSSRSACSTPLTRQHIARSVPTIPRPREGDRIGREHLAPGRLSRRPSFPYGKTDETHAPTRGTRSSLVRSHHRLRMPSPLGTSRARTPEAGACLSRSLLECIPHGRVALGGASHVESRPHPRAAAQRRVDATT
jgi:hypothetical protein